MNDLEDSCKSYAEVFQVVIHIRRMELQGERVHYYFHEQNNLDERHITIMLTNHNDEYDHCYSLLSILKWCQPITNATPANVAGYFDYRTKIKSSSNESK
jgi:hypothetical protein